jgi:membrane protease YdiL (CAAX protease family)
MDKAIAPSTEKPLRLLLFYVGACFLIWWGALLVFPAAEAMRSVLKMMVWLVPLHLLVRAQQKPVVWKIDIKRHWKPILLVIAGFLLYFLTRGQLLAQRGLHGFSASFFVNAVLIAPPVEEMVFRGVIFKQFAHQLPFWQADIGSSLIFTVYHIPLWLVRGQPLDPGTIGWVLVAGILFGWVFWKTDSLGAGTLVHGLHNLFLKILM